MIFYSLVDTFLEQTIRIYSGVIYNISHLWHNINGPYVMFLFYILLNRQQMLPKMERPNNLYRLEIVSQLILMI